MGGTLRLRLLGPVQVERDGEPLRGFESRKSLALLCYLTLHDAPLTRAHLADLFWPDKSEARGRGNLSRVLHNLSTLIPDCLRADRYTIQFPHPLNCWLDVEAFEELTAQGDADSLVAAVDLYRGDLMAGYYLDDCPEFETWLVAERERWHRRAARVLETLIEHHIHRGEHKQAMEYARRLLELDPWREEAHRQVMHLLARTGQRSAALAQYQTCCQILAEELGVEPGPETRMLYERIRNGELNQEPSPHRPRALAALPPFLAWAPPSPRPLAPFVARERQLAQLDEYLELALAGQGRVVFVTGESGSGKTALVGEFARRAQEARPDLVFAYGNCNAHTGIGDPYLPFREILGMLTGDIEAQWAAGAISRDHAIRLWNLFSFSIRAVLDAGPDLIETFVPGPTLVQRAAAFTGVADGANWLGCLKEAVERKRTDQGDPSLQQSALFDQFTRVLGILARQKPLLLVLDDLQWADAGSVSLLFHLGKRFGGSRILVVGAYRPAEVALGRGEERHPLEPVANEFKRNFGDIEVNLSQADDRQFVEALLDTEPNRLGTAFRKTLFRQTRGHPLFTSELVRGMQERGDLVQDETGRWAEGPALDWNRLPARVEAIIAERLSRLPAEWQATLAVASVEGEEFTAEVVAQVQGVAEGEIIRHLSGALSKQHRLVMAQSLQRRDGRRMSRYRFRHHMFQRYLYQSLDEVERAHLHEAVGKALEALYGKDAAKIAVQLARHFQEAGLMNKAIGYLLQAGDRARGLHAHQEAIQFYQQALVVLKAMGAYQRAAQTLMKLGLTYHLAFDFPYARRAYEEGFVLWRQASVGQMAPLPLAPHPLRMTWYDPITLDPSMASVEPSWMIIGQLFSGLVALNAELDVVPEVAQSWDVLEGGRKYIFHLRDDVHWSDGQSVTAEDFVYAWRRALDPALGSLNASYLFDIKGARSYHQGQVSDPICVGVRALDPVTLRVELEGPTSYFPQLLTRPPLYPVPRHVVEVHGDDWTNMKHLVTNGPFTLVRWERGYHMDLARNAGYRGKFTGNVQEVALTLDISSPLEELAMYEADRLDAMSFSWLPEATLRRQWHSVEYFSSPMLLTLYIGFNVRRPPFHDPRVRQAFAMAIDKEGLASAVLLGHSLPAMGGFVPPGMPGHAPSIGLPFDPERARCLLSEAGYPTGQGFPVVKCLRRSDLFKIECDYIRAQLHENLGINIEWETIKAGRVLGRLDSKPPHLGLASWGVDYPDPDNPLRVGVHTRWTGWQNQNYTQLLEQARRIINQAERIKLYYKADRILIEEASIVPLLYGRHHLWVKPWVSKYPVSVINWFFWKDVVIEPH